MGFTHLKKRQDFLSAAKKGFKLFSGSFVIQARRRKNHEDRHSVRIGFTASRKIGNAVARNRAKRRLRALAREVLQPRAENGWDYVLVARQSVLTYKYKKLKQDLAGSLKKLARKMDGDGF